MTVWALTVLERAIKQAKTRAKEISRRFVLVTIKAGIRLGLGEKLAGRFAARGQGRLSYFCAELGSIRAPAGQEGRY
jgi:hypothetical protein